MSRKAVPAVYGSFRARHPCVRTEGTTTSTGTWVTGGLAMAIASGLCGLAQGKAVASSAEAIARNPGAGGAIRGALLLGLVLIESLALYTLVIIFAKG